MLDLQPVLNGSRIALRPLELSDFDALASAAADPLAWAQHPDPSRGTRAGFALAFEEALRSKGCLVAVDSELETAIGWSRYHTYLPLERVTIGHTFLARSHWGGAANAEMKRLMLRHAFTDVPEVRFTVAERNLRSRRAVEKLGAQLAGTEDTPRWGQLHVMYRLTPELWRSAAAPGYGPEPPMA
ncbi:MAG TPA: GNAT family protein [Steroidobacteraceae bacterium]|jgi:RimJ/RimL family protein N-acetyltransferase|nr:GNAT family protein [Steroidobacteraceae bacterium]